MSRRILVTGAGGQLGKAILERLGPSWELAAPDRARLDIADAARLREAIAAIRPSWIVNCAAWTAVDRAETDRSGAFRVNDEALGPMADAAQAAGARILHFSTDYVFDGRSRRPYIETDPTAPLNVYGASKLAGERRLLSHGVRAVVLRSSWLYGEDGKNFFLTMLRLARQRQAGGPPLRVVDDQVGSPTSVHDLALQAAKAIDVGLEGLFHASAHGQVSWCGFARAILATAKVEAPVEAIASSDYPLPARRPAFSALENRALANAGLDLFRSWSEGLSDVAARWSGKS
jgi:dTDP-4-dehydrorhamnose reductase